MRVLLIRPFNNYLSELIRVAGLYEPVNLMYLAAVLKQYGHEVKLYDFELDPFKLNDVLLKIEREKFDIVGISAMTPTFPNATYIARKLKEKFPTLPIVLGGAHATLLFDEIARDYRCYDFIVRGEGEITLVELLDAIKSGRPDDLTRIKGLTFHKGAEVVHNPNRELRMDLNTLPFPDRSIIDQSKYKSPISPGLYRNKKNKYAEMLTSRGCPHRCKFCSIHTLIGWKYRLRSAENVIAEIDELISRFGYNYFFFQDDNFTLSKRHVFSLCELLRQRHIRWSCISRVDQVDEKMMATMKSAGCDKIAFGVESGSSRILKVIKKRITPLDAYKAFNLAKKYKLKTHAYLMVGQPTETADDIKKSIALMKRINPDFLSVSIVTPFPGTEIYDEAVKNGYLKKGSWSKFNFFSDKPVARSDQFTQEELYYWRRKFLTAFYLRIAYIWRKVLSLRTIYDIWYYLNAMIVFIRHALKPY